MGRKRVTRNEGRRGGAKPIPTTCDACGRGEGPIGGRCNHCGQSIETTGGAVDSVAFEEAIRANLSPEGVAALVMALQPAGSITATTPEGERAIEQVIWFRDTLLEMIGVETFNRTMDDLGF
jgi:hypothetical protein